MRANADEELQGVSKLYRLKAEFWWWLCVVVVYPLDGLLCRIRWTNLHRIPSTGAVIIAINHLSGFDPFLMGRLVWQAGRIPRFLVKASVFSWPLARVVVRGAKQIPVYRGTADASSSLREAVTALRRGEAVVIYPEGTITRDPELWPMQAKTGVARLVLDCPEVPVVPIGQWGMQHRAHLPWWRKLHRRHVCACVGEPLDLSRFRGQQPTADVLRDITDEIMSAIRDQVAELRRLPAPETFYQSPLAPVDRVA